MHRSRKSAHPGASPPIGPYPQWTMVDGQWLMENHHILDHKPRHTAKNRNSVVPSSTAGANFIVSSFHHFIEFHEIRADFMKSGSIS
jgi:hypothetical protein